MIKNKNIFIGSLSTFALWFLDILIVTIRQSSDDFTIIKQVLLVPQWESLMDRLSPFFGNAIIGIALLTTIPYILLVGALYGLVIGLLIKIFKTKLHLPFVVSLPLSLIILSLVLSPLILQPTPSTICENKAIRKDLEIRNQISFIIPNSEVILGKALIVNVDDWGGFYYRPSGANLNSVRLLCESYSLVEDVTQERPANSGTTLSIGHDFNVGYKKIVTLNVNLSAYANGETDEPYNLSWVVKEFTNAYELVRDGETLRLKYNDQVEGGFTTYSGITIRKVNGEYIDLENSVVELVSKDNGETWKVELR